MVLMLRFAQEKVPRSMTKAEWQEWWRWKRINERLQKEELERAVVLFKTQGIPDYVKLEMAECLINPPLLVPPWS